MSDTLKADADDPIKKRINKILESRLDTDKVTNTIKTLRSKTNSAINRKL